MFNSPNLKRRLGGGRGQGLAEYAMLLSLVALMVIAVLAFFGQSVREIYCDIVNAVPGGTTACQTDVVTLEFATYDFGTQQLHVHAFSDGGYNPSATLTTTPGGPMTAHPAHNHYHSLFVQPGCPCNVTITSSLGGSLTITVP